jgi:hypothetical protein
MEMRKSVVLLLVMVGLLLPVPGQALPNLWSDDQVVDLGVIVTGGRYRQTVQIENGGVSPLLLEGVESCCQVSAKLAGTVVPPGEWVALELEVYPFKFVGELRADVIVRSNDPRFPEYPVHVKALVAPHEYALAEMAERVFDLGVVQLSDRVHLRPRLRNPGNAPLSITNVTVPFSVQDAGSRPTVFPGEEHELIFFYRPQQVGPIEERFTIGTNDAFGRPITIVLKGYVDRQRVPDQAFAIWPLGQMAKYDAASMSYRLNVTVRNGGGREIRLEEATFSVPVASVDIDRTLPAGESVEGTITIPLNAGVAREGYLLLNVAIPIEW